MYFEDSRHMYFNLTVQFIDYELWGGAPPTPSLSHPPQMRISLSRHDLLGEKRWPISQKRRAKSLFLNGLFLGSICTGKQGVYVKLINHCQAIR